MLDELAVRNLGIIDEAHIEPGPGFTVVTGETGTGKTLLLGALRLLVGDIARTDMIGPHAPEARVDGRFIFDDNEEVAVARRVSQGRSRAYLDGAIAPAKAVEERLAGRVEIVGQHDQILLTRPSELRRLVDRSVSPATVTAYRDAWEDLQEISERIVALGGDRRALERELDLVTYQVDEIESAGFAAGDDVTLDQAVGRLRHVEELQELIGQAREDLDAAEEALGGSVAALRRAAELDRGLSDMVAASEGLAAQLTDLVREARIVHEGLERDPESLEQLEQRQATLSDLRRKYGATLEEVMSYAERTSKRRDELAELLDSADELASRHEAASSAVVASGAELRAARARAADTIANTAVVHLRQLGFDTPIVRVVVDEAEPTSRGADRVALEFASDERLKPGPVSRIASGGELSRLVLSLRLAAGAGDAAVVAFDEVDAGIGGATALEMGRKLAELARERQVLCVTHLPQVAAFATTHLIVERSDAVASVRVVEGEARIEELSRMLSGLAGSDSGQGHAEELLRLASG